MSKQQSQRRSDHDSPWKMALDTYFQEFLELLFPAIHKQIDWNQGYSFLDKELQQITADASSGRRYADKLIKIFAKDGNETWVLIHVEVQGEPEETFAERMYTYQYRLRDRYQVDVVSLAVLADTHPNYRPQAFHYQRWGCELTFTFPTAKLIDWMIQLPKGLERDFVRIVYEIQEEKKMAYINTIERYEREVAVEEGVQQGVQQGMQKGVRLGTQTLLKNLLQMKFGTLPDWVTQNLQEASQEQLEQWAGAILTADSLESVLKKDI